jgi:serine protease AprX
MTKWAKSTSARWLFVNFILPNAALAATFPMRHFLLLSLALLPICVFAQKPPVQGKYWIEFSDKDHTPFCTCRPWEFLSARALDRRARAGIAVTEQDLPVDPAYVAGLRQQGALLHHTSRWMNAATVIADSATAAALRQLPYVAKVQYVGRHIVPKGMRNRPQKKRISLSQLPETPDGAGVFGYTGLQNNLLGTPFLYQAGVRGRGILVAVMDGGFTNVDTLAFFDSLALQGRLLPGWDFIEHDAAVFEGASHGTSVLSVMAGHLPGFFVGTAPDASYTLLKTEDTAGEYPVEETNWIAGAEWADSIGADIINASLGYTSFNDTTLNHRYADLDGRSSIGARGAAIAATKGMIVCNSAGNSGDEPWRYVGVPADARGVIAVGAVDMQARHADFSSYGPTADGRIKPDLMAPGDQVIVAGNFGTQLGVSSGTSLASPMLVGSIAALWSSFPEKTASEILDAVFETADQNEQPDNTRGYGLPDMAMAWLRLSGYVNPVHFNRTGEEALFAYQRTQGKLSLLLFSDPMPRPMALRLIAADGQSRNLLHFNYVKNDLSRLEIEALDTLAPGAYRLELVWPEESRQYRVLVWK